MSEQQHAFVAMSGGVDSAVAAARLLQAGYRVTGIHMSTWKDPQWLAATQDLPAPNILAQEAADALGIPFVNLDVSDLFYESVVRPFIQHSLQGQTPNPCLFCNPQVKWGLLQTYALQQGADFFATGHYARIERSDSGRVRLLRGVDKSKDQSYVLAMLSQDQLRHSLLPLGDLTKAEVRAQARQLNLPVAEQQDSQDLCFLGNGDYRDFLERFAPEASDPGEIINLTGQVLGEHRGLAFYTIGQRKGIRIAAEEPYYVIRKDLAHNRLVVGFEYQTGERALQAARANWIAGAPPEVDEMVDVMVRYRAKPVSARLVYVNPVDFRLEFKEPVRGITPGQGVVLFRAEECLGGGVIQTTGKTPSKNASD